MSDVKWIKITTNMFDDEKIKLIEAMPDADTILVIWVKLLVQAGKTNASGYIFLNENIPYTDEMLATLFNKPLNTIRFALETFKKFGMVEMDENGIYINNWEKHQNIEGLEKIREQTRQRVQKHREQKKLKDASNDTETLRNAPEVELESDQNREEKIKYAEYVKMKPKEYSKLVERYGEKPVNTMIEMLDAYKGSKGKQYKDDYRAILSWVAKAYEEKHGPIKKQNNGESDAQRVERERRERLERQGMA